MRKDCSGSFAPIKAAFINVISNNAVPHSNWFRWQFIQWAHLKQGPVRVAR